MLEVHLWKCDIQEFIVEWSVIVTDINYVSCQM